MNELLTTKEAADFLKMSKSFLEKDRWSGMHGIPFCKLGRKVMYRRADLQKYIEKHIRTSTSKN